MSDVVISVESLYKEYRLGTISHGTLYRDVQSWWARMRGNEDPNSIIGTVQNAKRKESDATRNNPHILALNDVSFEVKKGDVLGIIGRNGAGKSTLLKILSEVTSPTKGMVKIKGRVASLLEVGTGFHPELTGRDNIYLNGAILGMTKKEIANKFDEIVSFAEIEKFIDTPVKRYSSGMYVRLAFAVAAHLEPEILIIDEVLAVGDAQFQKKCLGKMGDVAKEGRTILFVSHNIGAIATLCNKGIMLNAGQIVYQGDIASTIFSYEESQLKSPPTVEQCLARGGSGGITITDVWISNDQGKTSDSVPANKSLYLNMKLSVSREYQNGKKISAGFGIDTFEGRRLFTTVSSWVNDEIVTAGDRLAVQCCVPALPFISGKYLISASVLYQIDTLDCAIHCASFEVTDNEKLIHVNRTRDQGDLNLPSRFKVLDV